MESISLLNRPLKVPLITSPTGQPRETENHTRPGLEESEAITIATESPAIFTLRHNLGFTRS